MEKKQNGQVVTFYSYKGGTGRTMALANLAWILAANGKRILIVDWDLESPGLHRYFAPSLLDPNALAATEGVVNMVRGFEDLAAETSDEERSPNWYRSLARVQDYALAIRWPFPGNGVLHYMSSGLQNRSYSNSVATLDWERFYERLGGGELFNAFRADMKDNYDFAFIDSRTGLSDVADICTLHLPDVVIDCFTLNNQGIEGALTVANSVSRFTSHPIRLLAVPMRVDEAEKNKADAGRTVARSRFADLKLTELADAKYWGKVEIPYVPFYNYEETLATFADSPNDRHTLLDAYVRLAAVLTGDEVAALPELDEADRKSVLAEFSRLQPSRQEQVAIAYAAKDRLWAEWLEALYVQEGFDARIHPLFGDTSAQSPIDPQVRIVALMSTETTRDADAMTRLRSWSNTGQVAVAALSELGSDARLAAPSAELHGVADPGVAATALLRLAGVPEAEAAAARPPENQRFPTGQPKVWNVSARNAVFTGRDEAMERLRRQIIGGSATVILPVALHGLGGVGKTQLAREYAHRFGADYDLVWWINAESTEFIDEALADLARRLRLPGTGESITEDSLAVREALRLGQAGRWLLIYDNATDPTRLRPFLPSGTSGHVLITSRNQTWAQQAVPLEVDVFTKEESVEHLTRTVPGLEAGDALRIAELVGRLPLAVESAGAWLASTGTPVQHYIGQLNEQITQVLETPQEDYPVSVAATWNIALEELERRRPAAAWLLELCAFMNPDGISTTQLIYSNAMLETLRTYDRRLVDNSILGTVVAEPVRLSLLQLDPAARELRIHRLVQEVVRARMTPERQIDAQHAVHGVLAAARPPSGDTDDPLNWPAYSLLWPHMTPSQAIDCDEGDVRQLLIDRVRYLWKRGEYQNALDTGRRLEERWISRIEELGGQESDAGSLLYQQLLVLRNLQASVLRMQGAFNDAYTMDTEILAEQERLFGSEHPHTLLSYLCLAGDLRGLGRFEAALERDSESYELHRRVYTEGDARLLGAANNLAVNYRLLGQCFRAIDLDQSTYVQRMSTLGERHPYTLYSGSNLARDLRDAGQYSQSTDLLRAALARYRDAVGENSPETLRTAKSLAVSLRKGGDLTESLALSSDSFERYRSEFVATNPDRQSCTLVYAAALSAVGRHEQAHELSAEILAAYERQLGERHPYTLCCVNNIATYLRKLNRADEARRNAERAYNGFSAILGSEHPYTLTAAGNVANSLADFGEFAQAADMELSAQQTLANVLRPTHPDVLAIESNRSISLGALGETGWSRNWRSRWDRSTTTRRPRARPSGSTGTWSRSRSERRRAPGAVPVGSADGARHLDGGGGVLLGGGLRRPRRAAAGPRPR
jgi:MinD-like ATPase involved in chromosome partitioning or flagellar assembly